MNDHRDLPQTGFVTALWLKRYLSISNSTLYQWIADQRLPAPVKIGPRGALPRRGHPRLRGEARRDG